MPRPSIPPEPTELDLGSSRDAARARMSVSVNAGWQIAVHL